MPFGGLHGVRAFTAAPSGSRRLLEDALSFEAGEQGGKRAVPRGRHLRLRPAAG